MAARAVPAFYLHFIYCGMQFAVVANELNMRIAIIPEENEKSEPFSNRKQVRIFLVWWARVDVASRASKKAPQGLFSAGLFGGSYELRLPLFPQPLGRALKKRSAAPASPPCFRRRRRSAPLLFESTLVSPFVWHIKQKLRYPLDTGVLGGAKQPKSEPLPSGASLAAISSKVMVFVPSL